MWKNKKWIFGYKMLNMDMPDRDLIKRSVRNKLHDQKGEITMNKRKCRPLIIAAAVIATSFASAAVVNAATDGALENKFNELMTTVTVIINGKEVEAEGHIIDQDDSTVVYEFEIDDNSSGEGGKIEFERDEYVYTEDDAKEYFEDNEELDIVAEDYRYTEEK